MRDPHRKYDYKDTRFEKTTPVENTRWNDQIRWIRPDLDIYYLSTKHSRQHYSSSGSDASTVLDS